MVPVPVQPPVVSVFGDMTRTYLNARVAERDAERRRKALPPSRRLGRVDPEFLDLKDKAEQKVANALSNSALTKQMLQDEMEYENKKLVREAEKEAQEKEKNQGKSKKGQANPKPTAEKKKVPKAKAIQGPALDDDDASNPVTEIISILLLFTKYVEEGKRGKKPNMVSRQFAMVLWVDGPSIMQVRGWDAGWALKEYKYACTRGSIACACKYCSNTEDLLETVSQVKHQVWHAKYREFVRLRQVVLPALSPEPCNLKVDSRQEQKIMHELIGLWRKVDPEASTITPSPTFGEPDPEVSSDSDDDSEDSEDQPLSSVRIGGLRQPR